MTARDKRLERAQMRVLFQVPFFAPGVAKLPVEWDDTIDTACTDGQKIRWSGKFFDQLEDQQLVTVLCHEVCHCMLGHLWRAPAGADWNSWNQATDHAVNLMLKEFSALVMSKRLADPFPFPKPEEAYCADPRYAGQSEEAIYASLARQAPPGQRPKPWKGKSGGAGPPGVPGANSMPSFGQMSQPSPQAATQSKKLQSNWEGTLVQACQIGQGRGDIPASMSRLVDGLVNPRVPWQEILRSWLREQCSDDWNFLEPALEYSGSDFILPSLKSEKMGPVVFATDTSGSINGELLAQFQTEKQACLDDMRPLSLLDIYCDSKVHKVKEYRAGDKIELDAPGGGGTDFRPVFKKLDKLTEAPRCVVYLTDLDGTFPDVAPAVPVIWVTWTKNCQAPFGQTVYAGS